MKPETSDSFRFLSGGGEMGNLTRSKDWINTPLGNPENWPKSLFTTLSILLHSRFPMFLWWGPDLVCFYNDAYRPSLGLNGKHPTILGMRAIDAWPEIWETIKPLIDQVLGGGEGTWSEDQLIPIYRNGRIEDVYWTFSYSPVNDDSGIAGVLVTCAETTDKVNNFKLLAETNDQLQFAIEATELGTWDMTPGTNKFIANDRLKDWFGQPAKAVIELSLALSVIAEKDRQRVSESIIHALQYSSGGNYEIEYTIIHPTTGKERIVKAKGRAWFNDDTTCYRFNGTLQDITAQVMTHKKTEESEEKFRMMTETLPDIAWVASPNGPYSFYNKRFYDYTGMSVEQAHKDWKWQSIVHPDMFELRNEVWLQCIKTGEDFYFESLLKRNSDQTYRWHISRASGIKNEKGEITLWVGSSSDIHEQKLFSQELEKQVLERTRALVESNIHLQQLNENLEQFAAIASHDLQEPLRKIQTFSLLLEQRYKKDIPDEAIILIDKIKSSSQRMSVLISDVLNFSRITQSQQGYEAIDLNLMVKHILVDYELLIHEKKVQVTFDNLPTIMAIGVQMNQLFNNLLGNAIKFSKETVNPEITITCKLLSQEDVIKYPDLNQSLSYFNIQCTDNGIGFDQQFAEQIFLIFHKLNTGIQYSGTGIGLALCKRIVENHHGHIFAEGRENEGANFHIILPVSQS